MYTVQYMHEIVVAAVIIRFAKTTQKFQNTPVHIMLYIYL